VFTGPEISLKRSHAGSSREIDNGCGSEMIDSVLTNRDTLAVGFYLFGGLYEI
jgi:hypothetical protein